MPALDELTKPDDASAADSLVAPNPPSAGKGGSSLIDLTGNDKNTLGALTGMKRDQIAESNKGREEATALLDRDQKRVEQQYEASGYKLGDFQPWNAAAEHETHSTDPLVAFGSLGSVFGMIASAFTHAPMENALNASAAAMNAIKEGDEKEYERAHEAWKQNTDLAFKRHQMQREGYQDAITLMNTNMQVGDAKARMLAAKYGDAQSLLLLEAGMSKEWIDLQEKRNDAAVKMTASKNMLEQDGFNRAVYTREAKQIEDSDVPPKEKAQLKLKAFNHYFFHNEKQSPELDQMGQFMWEHRMDNEGKGPNFEQMNSAWQKLRKPTGAGMSQEQQKLVLERTSQLVSQGMDPTDAHEEAIRQATAAAAKPTSGGGATTGKFNAATLEAILADVETEHRDWTKGKQREEAQKKFASAKKGGGGMVLDEPTLESLSEQAIAGDTSVYTNLGRSIQGSENIIKLRQRVAEKLAAQGKTGKDQATATAQYQGLRAAERTAGTREATVGIAAFEAKNMMSIARDYSEKVARTQWVPVNKAIQMVEAGASDPDLKAFAAANNALVNGYVRAISPTGVPTDIVRKHAYDTLSTADSKEAYNAVLKLMNIEMDAAISAPEQMKKQLLGQTTEKQSPPSPPNIIKYDKDGNRVNEKRSDIEPTEEAA